MLVGTRPMVAPHAGVEVLGRVRDRARIAELYREADGVLRPLVLRSVPARAARGDGVRRPGRDDRADRHARDGHRRRDRSPRPARRRRGARRSARRRRCSDPAGARLVALRPRAATSSSGSPGTTSSTGWRRRSTPCPPIEAGEPADAHDHRDRGRPLGPGRPAGLRRRRPGLDRRRRRSSATAPAGSSTLRADRRPGRLRHHERALVRAGRAARSASSARTSTTPPRPTGTAAAPATGCRTRSCWTPSATCTTRPERP